MKLEWVKLQNIIDILPDLLKGLKVLARLSCGEDNEITLLQKILSGQTRIWKATIEGSYAGFALTRPCRYANGQWYLLIEGLYGENGHMNQLWWDFGLKILENHAKEMKCKDVKFYTIRDKAFQLKVAPYGYKQERVIFSKEVG